MSHDPLCPYGPGMKGIDGCEACDLIAKVADREYRRGYNDHAESAQRALHEYLGHPSIRGYTSEASDNRP